MAIRRAICVFVLFSLLIDCHAFWGRSSKKESPDADIKTEWRQLSLEEEETRFVFLVSRRNQIREDLTVLARLLEEKNTEQARIDNAFKEAFGIEADKSYRFDRTEKSLYLLPSIPQNSGVAASSEESATGSDRGVLHKSLSEKQAAVFLRAAQARQRIQDTIQSIYILNSEKLKQWGKVRDELQREFGIQQDQNYHYDKEKRIIYKLDSKTGDVE